MSQSKTHRLSKEPKVSARHLADYMAASETAQRSIIRDCKYRAIARIVQHDLAKATVGRFFRDSDVDVGFLTEEAESLRNRLADDPFERDVLDHNADYIDRFALVSNKVELPSATVLPPGPDQPVVIEGVKVAAELQWRMRRTTKSNLVRVGAGTLRYAKGKPLSEVIAAWHSAFLFGYLGLTGVDEAADPEKKLCIVVDAYSGIAYPAPSNAVQRFNQMKSACATIAERWPNIQPPPNAIL